MINDNVDANDDCDSQFVNTMKSDFCIAEGVVRIVFERKQWNQFYYTAEHSSNDVLGKMMLLWILMSLQRIQTDFLFSFLVGAEKPPKALSESFRGFN